MSGPELLLHTHTHTHSHTLTETHTHTLSLSLSLTHTHTHIHPHSLSHTHTHTHTLDRDTHTHTHAHTHRQRHTHTHTRAQPDNTLSHPLCLTFALLLNASLLTDSEVGLNCVQIIRLFRHVRTYFSIHGSHFKRHPDADQSY